MLETMYRSIHFLQVFPTLIYADDEADPSVVALKNCLQISLDCILEQEIFLISLLAICVNKQRQELVFRESDQITAVFNLCQETKNKERSPTKLDGQLGADAGLLDLLDLELDQGVVVLDPWHILAQEVSIVTSVQEAKCVSLHSLQSRGYDRSGDPIESCCSRLSWM